MTKKIVIAFIVLVTITVIPFTRSITAAFDCLTLTPNSPQFEKNYCQSELDQIEAELVKLLDLQKQQQKQTGTLIGDVNYLTSQINALKTKIQARALVIAQLKVNITEKNNTIKSLSSKIEREHKSLGQLLRNTNELDGQNMVHLVLARGTVSDFYSNIESYVSIKEAVKESVDKIKGVKTETEIARTDLEKKQNAETNARVELEAAQRKVAQSEAEKKRLLSISKDTEAAYKTLAADKKSRADKIRAALFPLRDSVAIPFGDALRYAEQASAKTGVRPALVLAVLKQETNMGANVGSCVITNLSTGETKGINSGKIFPVGIHPTRDLPLLQTIVRELGRNPLDTRISCPLEVGYGGAMGPAQFIPSTWNIIKSKLSSALGKSVPDPWNPADAIMASAILLGDSGARSQTYTAERDAACRYFSGRGCQDPTVKNVFYGNSVMAIATKMQADIDLLSP